MYAALWRLLPGPRWARTLQCLVLFGLVVWVLFQWVFPALSPLLLRKSSPAALALTAYFAATSLAVLLGAYPVPLAGYGLSFVIGWWLGFASVSRQQVRA